MSDLEAEMARQIEARGLPTPERELVFDDRRRWRFDFAWPAPMVAMEVEGATWAGGRHTRGAGFEADCEKYNAASLAGWTVLRVTAAMVRNRRALTLLEQALA